PLQGKFVVIRLYMFISVCRNRQPRLIFDIGSIKLKTIKHNILHRGRRSFIGGKNNGIRLILFGCYLEVGRFSVNIIQFSITRYQSLNLHLPIYRNINGAERIIFGILNGIVIGEQRMLPKRKTLDYHFNFPSFFALLNGHPIIYQLGIVGSLYSYLVPMRAKPCTFIPCMAEGDLNVAKSSAVLFCFINSPALVSQFIYFFSRSTVLI